MANSPAENLRQGIMMAISEFHGHRIKEGLRRRKERLERLKIKKRGLGGHTL